MRCFLMANHFANSPVNSKQKYTTEAIRYDTYLSIKKARGTKTYLKRTGFCWISLLAEKEIKKQETSSVDGRSEAIIG